MDSSALPYRELSEPQRLCCTTNLTLTFKLAARCALRRYGTGVDGTVRHEVNLGTNGQWTYGQPW